MSYNRSASGASVTLMLTADTVKPGSYLSLPVEVSQSQSRVKAAGFAAWLVDLDGTLYRQLPLRLAMATELLLLGRRHIPIIRRFRHEQELLRSECCELAGPTQTTPYHVQIERTAKAMGATVEEVASVVREWMEERPRKWLKLFRRRGLLNQIAAFRAIGGKTALVSDYPAQAKLIGLGVEALFDVVVACGESGGPPNLKPSPDGLLLAAQRLGIAPQHCLVIGDRDDADGEAARRAGMTFRSVR